MPQDIYHHSLPNGMVLLAEKVPNVRSAALNFLVPTGCIHDPPDRQGLGSLLADLIIRGAGARDSRELSVALDNLGVDRDESVAGIHMHFWGGTLGRNLPAAMEIYSDIIRRPRLPAEELDAVKALAYQDLQSLEDEPRSKMLIELRKRHYPAPLGNDRRGTKEGIENTKIEDIRKHYRRLFRPKGTILSVAGAIDWPRLKEQVERLFGDWQGGEEPHITYGPPLPKRDHIQKDTTQTQIGLAYASVPIGHPDYYAAQGAVNVLSGGMSARLFTEVREKRGLCYAVWASYQTFKDRASILCYAGTTNERAQETLDVTLQELKRLEEGIELEELDRVKAGLKSSLIMQQESTSARARAMAGDWYFLGRIRSFEEIQREVNALSPEGIVAHLRRCPAKDFTIVTLGPKALELKD